MGAWLEFLQVALALGAGWLGYVLFRIARAAPQGPAASRRQASAALPAVKRRAVDSEL